jgi:hypothetical protein
MFMFCGSFTYDECLVVVTYGEFWRRKAQSSNKPKKATKKVTNVNSVCVFLCYVQNLYKSRDGSIGIALGYGLDDRDSRVRFPAGLGIFLFTTASRTALGPTQSPIQWVPGVLSLEVKRTGREADHSPPSSAEVKECVELYLSSSNAPSWPGAQLKKKTQGQLYLYFYIYRICFVFLITGAFNFGILFRHLRNTFKEDEGKSFRHKAN